MVQISVKNERPVVHGSNSLLLHYAFLGEIYSPSSSFSKTAAIPWLWRPGLSREIRGPGESRDKPPRYEEFRKPGDGEYMIIGKLIFLFDHSFFIKKAILTCFPSLQQKIRSCTILFMTRHHRSQIEKRYNNTVPIPSWWRSKESEIQDFLNQTVRRGQTVELARSPGGRPVRAVIYGKQDLSLRGTANHNSALGAGRSDAYWRRSQRRAPTLFILAGMHGHEVEGMIGALSVMRLMEEGVDLEGNAQPDLLEKLQATRLIVIPLANPDGRARVPYDGWGGIAFHLRMRSRPRRSKRTSRFRLSRDPADAPYTLFRGSGNLTGRSLISG